MRDNFKAKTSIECRGDISGVICVVLIKLTLIFKVEMRNPANIRSINAANKMNDHSAITESQPNYMINGCSSSIDTPGEELKIFL